ncbi:hypothetical protein [Massilia orientalis]|jgi:hypothetical protein|uniref:Uncharacterized protein n=1 Tax=Massilia orientalis TaxID=3050128 RepID=A0ACC7MC28_9BURK|nr:hypothetical protein [Massilia sp. YIM B02787]
MANDEKPKQAAPAAPPPPSPAEALSTAHQVEELADKLSACADSIHQRVMRDIRRHQGQDVPEPEQMAARALLNAEMELRQRANRLYAEAAACVVSALGQPQAHLVQLTVDAADKIKRITRIGDGITLVARLLGLAAAASTGQVVPILAALDGLKTQLDIVAIDNAPSLPASSA